MQNSSDQDPLLVSLAKKRGSARRKTGTQDDQRKPTTKLMKPERRTNPTVHIHERDSGQPMMGCEESKRRGEK
jgi:hypothetical protein